MTLNPDNPFDAFAETSLPEVTIARVLEQLAADNIEATADPADDGIAIAHFNDLDWVFSVSPSLTKVECVLPTELDYELTGMVMATIANELNGAAFDGRALIGEVDNTVELRGDASFVAIPGMSDEQLFHALNFAIVAAQEALLGLIDGFNAIAREAESRTDD